MLGQRSSQWSLFDVEYYFRHLVGEDSFHWQLWQVRDQLFQDEEFAALYVFEGAVCDDCPLRPQCVKAAPVRGRSVSLHP